MALDLRLQLQCHGRMLGRRVSAKRWVVWVVGAALYVTVSACSSTSTVPGAAGGGDGAAGGSGPERQTNVLELRQPSIDKIDLLLTIDNSTSMKDKQELLAQALPYLVQRLVTPRCVRACTSADNCTPRQERDGIAVGRNADAAGQCAAGRPEMPPVQDIHLGVISSSLGSHGAVGKNDLCVNTSDNDHAHLLGTVRRVAGTYQELGFLFWDSSAKGSPPGESDPKTFSDKVTELIESAGENGCELEATLEAWYRFLIDPEPPAAIGVPANETETRVLDVDEVELTQRKAFLRPDSLVIIAMLSDENDCSILDEGYGWLAARRAAMYAGTSACAVNPNDKCCASCAEPPNTGCPSSAQDPACKTQQLAAAVDSPKLRCFDQKRRFGLDLLYPISRYVDGLSSPLIIQRSTGQMVNNPLFAATNGASPRDRALVQVLGIIGVPWQDIADEETLTSAGLSYLTASELEANGRWDVVLGDPGANPRVPPTDPLMQEATQERTGTNPITNDLLAPSTAATPKANLTNGHEHANVDDSELQYACIYPLSKPRVCDAAAKQAGVGCDCVAEDAAAKRPVCQSPVDGASGTTQYYAKAYPGTRFLQLFKEGSHGNSEPVVASICPKVLDPAAPGYGYLPAIDGLIRSIRPLFRPLCLPTPLPVDETTRQIKDCQVVSSQPMTSAGCDCQGHGWTPLTTETLDTARRSLLLRGECGSEPGDTCDNACVCGIPQLAGKALAACQNGTDSIAESGFCYINGNAAEQMVGNPELVQDCPEGGRRLLRFTGDVPTEANTLLICDAAVSTTSGSQ